MNLAVVLKFNDRMKYQIFLVRSRKISEGDFICTPNLKISEGDFICTPDGNQVTDESEARKEGKVEAIVYKSYAVFSGWFITVLTCLSTVLVQVSRIGNDMWLSDWVDASGRNQKHI